MLSELARAPIQPGRTSIHHPRSSFLIRVHLRFHFRVPEQARCRRGGTIAIFGRKQRDAVRHQSSNALFLVAATGRAVCSACVCPEIRTNIRSPSGPEALQGSQRRPTPSPIAGSPSHGRSVLDRSGFHRAQVLEADEAAPKLQQAFGFNVVRSDEGQIAIGADRIG